MNESFGSSGSSDYQYHPNIDVVGEEGKTSPRKRKGPKSRSPQKSPTKSKHPKKGEERLEPEVGGRPEEMNTVESVIDTVRRRAFQKTAKSGLVDGLKPDPDSDAEEEESISANDKWSASEMKKLLEVIQIHGCLHVGHAREALPEKTEVEIGEYFEYLTKTASVGPLAVNSGVKGLVYTPSFSPHSDSNSTLRQRRKWRNSGPHSHQSFSGYMESRESFRPTTERLNLREAMRRSMEEEDAIPSSNSTSSLHPPPPTIKRNHAEDWMHLVESLHEKRGAPCDFSESLILALQILANIVRQYDNKQDHVINNQLISFMHDNLYKYIFCLLKGVEPIQLSPIESGIMLELTDRLRARVRQTDTTQMKEYLDTIKEHAKAGSLRFDTAEDVNSSAGSYARNEATQPDMMSVNPLCISRDLLVPKYLPETSENVVVD